MPIQKLIKWNLLILTSIFLIACSDSGSDKPTTSRELEIPSGHVITEGDDATTLLTLYFISPVDGPLSYSNFNITAAEKSDYEPISGTIQAEKGKEYAFDVVIFGDNEIEGDESFGINFKNDQNESVSSIVGKIENDDFPGVSVTSPQVLEGDSGVAKLVFTFSLSVAVVDDYAILITSTAPENLTDSQRSNYAYIALPGEDYQAVNQIVKFSSGELEKTLEVEVFAENIVEEDEVVLLAVVDAKGTPVLEGVYAKGIIRSDETKEVNGFNLSYDAAIELKNINEGTPAIDSPDIWIKTSLPISVVYPENIIQDQTLVFKVLSKTEAQSKGFIDEASENYDYIDTSSKHDICFNSSEGIALEGCQLSSEYSLNPNDVSVSLDFYVRGDKNRELDERYIIAINNDQGVNFTNIDGKIINDDSERLEIKVDGQFVDLINYTSANNIYEVSEPSTSNIEHQIELRLTTVLESPYALNYSIKEHESAVANSDFEKVKDAVLNFEIINESQIKSIPVLLMSDQSYDGDKYIKIIFEKSNIEPLIIKINDSDFPDVKIKKPNGDDVVPGNDEYAFLYEQDEGNPQDVNASYREYTYALSIDDDLVALSDLRYKIVISSPDDQVVGDTCVSSDRSDTFSSATIEGDTSDFSVGYGSEFEEIKNGDGLYIKRGSLQTNWSIRVKNDKDIECIEQFSIKFIPDLKDDDSGQVGGGGESNTVPFAIIDIDKANITVAGWQALEGDINQTQNFVITSDKAVSTSFNADLSPNPSDMLGCAASDLLSDQEFSRSIALSSSDFSVDFPVNIIGDQIVEPNEECRLNISGDDADLINITYQDINGDTVSDENIKFSSGSIINNDKLNILFDVSAKTEPAEVNSTEVSMGYVYWGGNGIASNVNDINLQFVNEVCGEEDCIESLDIEMSDPLFRINDAVFNSVSNRYEKVLPIKILSDNIVENTEAYKISVVRSSGDEYISNLQGMLESTIINEDILALEFSEKTEAPLVSAASGDETGYRYYKISWGDKSVSSTVGELTVDLADEEGSLSLLNGKALRKLNAGQSVFDYVLVKDSVEFYGNKIIIKKADEELLENTEIEFELRLNDDDLIEIQEAVVIGISSDSDTPVYIKNFSKTEHHLIGIDDRLLVEITVPNSYSDNSASSNEEDTTKFEYEISLSGELAENIPELALALSNTGRADQSNDNTADYSFNISEPSAYDNNILTLKSTIGSLLASPVLLTYEVSSDNYVEITEDILTTFSNTHVNSAYIELRSLNGAETNKLELTHNIISEDKTYFYITQDDTSDTSAEEGEGDPPQSIIKTYTINWTKPIGKGVSNLEFDLPFLGTATKGSDYILTSSDISQLTINEKLYSTSPDVYRERFRIIKDSESVLGVDGSVSFNIEIKDDTEVEGTESILASLTEYDGIAEYISFSDTNNAITHYITSEEGVTFSLTQISGNTESNEADRAYNRYRIEWSDDIGIGVGDISFQIKFSQASNTGLIATKGSDYSVTSNSNKLIIDGETFKIKKDSDKTLTKGHLDFTVRVSNNNDLVEPDETYTLEMKKITGTTPTFITVDQDNKIVSHKIIDTNKAELSLYPFGSNKKFGDESYKHKLHYWLYSDKEIAENVPNLSFKIKLATSSLVNGNATIDDVNIEKYDQNDHDLEINEETITFKKIGSKRPKSDWRRFYYEIVDDNGLVERDEDFTGSLQYISENDESKKYISFHDTLSKLKAYTILNDDKITLSLISPTVVDPNKTEADEESLNYSLKWNAPVAADVPALSVTLAPSSSDGQATVDDYTVAPVDASKLTIANKKIYKFKAANKFLSVNDQGIGTVDFVISVKNDLDIEMDEMLKASLADENASFVKIDTENNRLSHKIITDGDKLPLTISRVPLAEGISDTENEDNWNTKQYTITWPDDISVSKHVPELSLNFDLSTSSDVNEPIAIEDGDFTVAFAGTTRTNEKILIKNAGAALSPDGTYTFSFNIKNDNMVEIDERIEAKFLVLGDNAQYVELTNPEPYGIIHKIKSEDKTTLSVSPVDSNLSNAASEETEVTRIYKLSSTNPISKDVPDIKVNLSMASGVGYAQFNSDYDFLAPVLDNTGDVYTAHKQGGSDTSDGQLATFSITTKIDNLVEYDEIFEATLSLNSGTDYAVIDTDTSKKTVSHTIENDDFIELELVSTNECNLIMTDYECTLDEGDSVKLKPSAGYETQGIPETGLAISLSAIGSTTAESSDYTLTNSIQIPSSYDDANAAYERNIVSLVTDTIIEENENIDLSWTMPSFVSFIKPSKVIIRNDDYLTASFKYYDATGSTEMDYITEGSVFKLELCKGTDTYENTDAKLNISLTIPSASTPPDESNTLKYANCDHFEGEDSNCEVSKKIDISGLESSNCVTSNALLSASTNAQADQNVFFNVEFSSSDMRCDGNCLSNLTNQVIMNDDLINVLDTGLVECVESGFNKRWDVPCSGDNSHVPDASYSQDYQYQDGASTDFYPQLTYTYFNQTGQPVIEKPNVPTDQVCFQDNSTGLIFSSSSENALVFSEKNNLTVDECGLLASAEKTWLLPSVQELITIMDLNPISNAKPLSAENILGLNKTGGTFYSDNSTYWTKDECNTTTIVNGRWTVDFISGHLTCANTTETNFFIKVYK